MKSNTYIVLTQNSNSEHMTEETTTVNCNFCKKQMQSPANSINKKQMCYECFCTKEHTDTAIKECYIEIPQDEFIEEFASTLAQDIVERAFPTLWKTRENTYKDLSTKDLAQELFGQGAYLGIKSFMQTTKEWNEGRKPHARRKS